MSDEAVNVVSDLLAAHDGQDVLPRIEHALNEAGAQPAIDQAAEALEKDPGWRLYHPEIEWDMTRSGLGETGLGGVHRGYAELFEWWSNFARVWGSYVYHVRDRQDLGEWVLTKGDVVATARNGQAVEMPVWQLWAVGDGRVTVMRAFITEADARDAVGV
jgi:ketosteroid isomerase-like protein